MGFMKPTIAEGKNVKNHFGQFFHARQVLTAIGLSLFANFAHAYANYQASASGQLEIYSIANQTNPGGDLSFLNIDGNVSVDNTGHDHFGLADANDHGFTSIQAGGAGTDPGLLTQSSDVQGYADTSPFLSHALSYNSSLGQFTLRNQSATDTVQVDLSLIYTLAVNAAASNILNDNAYANAFVNLTDTLTGVLLDRTLSADAQGLLAPPNDSWGDNPTFSVILQPGDVDQLTFRVGVSGNAQSIPEPATIFLMAGGLAGLMGVGKRRQYAIA
jgi:hypothetical protein